MFVTFTYLFFFFVADADLISVCVSTSPMDSIRSGRYAIFVNDLKKSLYGRNLLLTIQNLFSSFYGTSDSPPMRGYSEGLSGWCTTNV